MNDIILIDDDNDFATSFINEAYAHSKIKVTHKRSLTLLKTLLPALGHKYAAVVLDIKGIIDDDQAKEDASFITAALKYLDTTIPGFPRFILTGDESEFDTLKRYYQQEKLFLKKPEDQESLLKELHECVSNAEPLRIIRENNEVFKVFEKQQLSSIHESKLIEIFKGLKETNPMKFKGIIGDIREIHEEIYKSINARNKSLVPDKFMTANGSPSFTSDFYHHLIGCPSKPNYMATSKIYQDSTISGHTRLLNNACSEYLHNSSKTKYLITKYTLRALINSLAEIIIWSTKY